MESIFLHVSEELVLLFFLQVISAVTASENLSPILDLCIQIANCSAGASCGRHSSGWIAVFAWRLLLLDSQFLEDTHCVLCIFRVS